MMTHLDGQAWYMCYHQAVISGGFLKFAGIGMSVAPLTLAEGGFFKANRENNHWYSNWDRDWCLTNFDRKKQTEALLSAGKPNRRKRTK